MSNKELKELLKYCSPNIIYIINAQNRIIKLYTPFRLVVLQDIGELKVNQIVECTLLKITTAGKLIFYISGKHYYPKYFDILAI